MFPDKIFLPTLIFLTEFFDKMKHVIECFIEKYVCVIRRPNHSKLPESKKKKKFCDK